MLRPIIRTILISATAAAGLAATPALAERNVVLTGAGYEIRSADLDLGTQAGRAALLGRVEFAARQVCDRVRSRRHREQCESDEAMDAVGGAPRLRAAIQMARSERGDVRLASR